MKICWVRLLGNRFGSELMPLMLLETPLLLLKDPGPKTLTTACLLKRRLRFCSDGRDRKATRCVDGSQSECHKVNRKYYDHDVDYFFLVGLG
ncbi:hypothetical protein Hdeb2414_s0001g00012211 [Helianthus debilis subsp. tardiflorus]